MSAASAELCARFGLETPIFQGGMGWVSTGRLAAAVSAAGGLGVIATGGHMHAAELRSHIDRVREEAPGRPFGVNVLVPAGASADDGFANESLLREQLDVVLAGGAPVLVCGLGDPTRLVPECHAAGVKVVAVVGTARAARKCAAAGVDAVVVQGSEAGGHVGPIGTLTLGQVALAHADCPVLLAGGIATPGAVAAAIAAGASGVSIGTRFIASDESDAHERYKQALVGAGEQDTAVTRACTGKPSRAFRNDFVRSWEGREDEIAPYPAQALENFWRARAGAIDGDIEEGFLPMGQCAAAIDEVLPAATIVERLGAAVQS